MTRTGSTFAQVRAQSALIKTLARPFLRSHCSCALEPLWSTRYGLLNLGFTVVGSILHCYSPRPPYHASTCSKMISSPRPRCVAAVAVLAIFPVCFTAVSARPGSPARSNYSIRLANARALQRPSHGTFTSANTSASARSPSCTAAATAAATARRTTPTRPPASSAKSARYAPPLTYFLPR